jgi:hypothetical protein
MILKRYGTSMHSVELNFDSKAMTEIGFRRDKELSISVESFEQGYTRAGAHELTAQTEGYIQDEVERKVLKDLETRIRELEKGLSGGAVLVVESEQGIDYPKTRTEHKTVVEGGENRLYFTVRVAPPLRIAQYNKGG